MSEEKGLMNSKINFFGVEKFVVFVGVLLILFSCNGSKSLAKKRR
jgi:hypothetical protein